MKIKKLIINNYKYMNWSLKLQNMNRITEIIQV